jgi:integrase
MASLHVRHARACSSRLGWAKPDDGAGCTCQPTFYVIVRDGRRTHRERVGRNRKQAERALTKTQSQEDDDAFTPIGNVRFDEWADRYLATLQGLEPSTRDSYRHTMAYAKRAFGSKHVRKLTIDDVHRFLALMVRDVKRGGVIVTEPVSASTRAKHLRVLSACLNSAIKRGYTVRNVVSLMPDGERPRRRKREAPYFTQAELPRLFEAIEHGVYRVLFLVALKTGMRLGELLALTWGDVELIEATIHVRHSWTGGRLTGPKSHEKREVHLADDVVDLLGGWWGELGEPDSDRLVLPGATKTGYLNDKLIREKQLYPAMQRAGIQRIGETGFERTFHSFRHTFAKRALENDRAITWLSRHLGHSSLDVTTEIYGHWEHAERKRQAEAPGGSDGRRLRRLGPVGEPRQAAGALRARRPKRGPRSGRWSERMSGRRCSTQSRSEAHFAVLRGGLG